MQVHSNSLVFLSVPTTCAVPPIPLSVLDSCHERDSVSVIVCAIGCASLNFVFTCLSQAAWMSTGFLALVAASPGSAGAHSANGTMSEQAIRAADRVMGSSL